MQFSHRGSHKRLTGWVMALDLVISSGFIDSLETILALLPRVDNMQHVIHAQYQSLRLESTDGLKLLRLLNLKTLKQLECHISEGLDDFWARWDWQNFPNLETLVVSSSVDDDQGACASFLENFVKRCSGHNIFRRLFLAGGFDLTWQQVVRDVYGSRRFSNCLSIVQITRSMTLSYTFDPFDIFIRVN